jgi:hypothetical protein
LLVDVGDVVVLAGDGDRGFVAAQDR